MKYISISIDKTGPTPELFDTLGVCAIIDDLESPKPLEELKTFECILSHNDGLRIHIPHSLRHFETLKKLDQYMMLVSTDKIKADFYKAENKILSPKEFFSVFNLWIKREYFPNDKQDLTKPSMVEVNIAGKGFPFADGAFLEKLPDSNLIKYDKMCCLDPSIFYIRKDKDSKIPDLKTCLEREGIYNSEIEYNAKQKAWSIIQLIRANNKTK